MDDVISRATRRLPVRSVIAAQLALILAYATGAWMNAPAAGVTCAAALLALGCVMRWRGRLVIDWFSGLAARSTAPDAAYYLDFELATVTAVTGTVGIRREDERATAALEVTGVSLGPTAFGRNTYAGGASVPLKVLADFLTEQTILDGVDVVSHGFKSTQHHPSGTYYARLTAPLPAASHRRTFVVLRMDVRAARSEIERRTGGEQAVGQLLTVAALRLRRRLAALDVQCTPLRAADMERLDQTTPPFDCCYAVHASGLTTEGLLPVWQPSTARTALAIQIRTWGRRERASEQRYAVTAVAGHAAASGEPHLRVPVAKAAPISRGAESDVARRLLLPFGSDASPPADPAYLSAAQLASLHLPALGCGQLVGTDTHGRAIMIPLASAPVSRCVVAGHLQIAQQVVVRALATGAQVRIATTRPHAWSQMLSAREHDWVALAPAPWRLPANEAPRVFVVDDDEYAVPAEDAVTVLYVRGPSILGRADSTQPEAEIVIEQSPQPANSLRLTISGRWVDLTAVALPEEMDYLTRVTPSPGSGVPVHPDSRVPARAG